MVDFFKRMPKGGDLVIQRSESLISVRIPVTDEEELGQILEGHGDEAHWDDEEFSPIRSDRESGCVYANAGLIASSRHTYIKCTVDQGVAGIYLLAVLKITLESGYVRLLIPTLQKKKSNLGMGEWLCPGHPASVAEQKMMSVSSETQSEGLSLLRCDMLSL